MLHSVMNRYLKRKWYSKGKHLQNKETVVGSPLRGRYIRSLSIRNILQKQTLLNSIPRNEFSLRLYFISLKRTMDFCSLLRYNLFPTRFFTVSLNKILPLGYIKEQSIYTLWIISSSSWYFMCCYISFYFESFFFFNLLNQILIDICKWLKNKP